MGTIGILDKAEENCKKAILENQPCETCKRHKWCELYGSFLFWIKPKKKVHV